MANVKRFSISGVLPYDLGTMSAADEAGRKAGEAVQRMLAVTLWPGSNMVLEWDRASCGSRPVDGGGQVILYRFRLRGTEALSWSWFDELGRQIKAAGGYVEHRDVVDLDA